MQLYIQTYSGKKVYLDNLDNNIFDIEDIAHSLSQLCRWTGHTKQFYSIAQHSYHVSEHSINKLDGLLHDATEYVLNDLSSPVKKLGDIEHYVSLEHRLHIKIANQFGTQEVIPQDVKHADKVLLFTEKRDLFNYNIDWGWGEDIELLKRKITCWSPKKAKVKFLDRYYQLTEQNK